MREVVLCIVAASLTLAGCAGLKCKSGSWGGGCSSHFSDGKAGRTDWGVSYLTLDGRVYFVLVSAGGSGGRCGGGPPGSGTLQATDGRAVAWACDTPDGRTGRVTIGAERFELEKGPVFLVNVRDGKTVVEQVAVEARQLQGGVIEDRLKVVTQSNERLAAFLKVCETPK
jgi:hypothetical protein